MNEQAFFILKELIDTLEGCILGKRKCQEALYKIMYPALYSLCKSIFQNEQDVITAINNGMLKVFANISKYNKEHGSLFNWIYTIVRNEALTHVRNIKIYKDTVTFQEAENPYSYYDPFKKLEWKDIYFYLNKLPVTTRCVCRLFYLEHLSVKEISEGLKMKEGTVKWHLNEGRTRLKVVFNNHQYLVK